MDIEFDIDKAIENFRIKKSKLAKYINDLYENIHGSTSSLIITTPNFIEQWKKYLQF